MDTMSKERTQEVITATRQALTNSIKELGTPIEVGMLNFDKATLHAIERYFIIR